VGPHFAKQLVEGLSRDRGFDGSKTSLFRLVGHLVLSFY
jgi:hypothetical protein